MSRFAQLSRGKYHREVCSLSRPAMLSIQPTQPISAPLQTSIRFLPDVMSAPPWDHLTMDFPLLAGERYGFTLFR